MSEIKTTEGEKKEFCAVCKCFTEQKCSACKSVYYCSREHQKLDWTTHSKNCQAFMLIKNSSMGRHYIATRDIKINEIILKENEPLLVGPVPHKMLACLNCYVPLTLENVKPCENCGWPLCNDCERHGPECQLTMKYRESKVEISKYLLLMNQPNFAIYVLKALALKEKSLNCYKKFLNLQQNYTDMMKLFDGLIPAMILQEARILKMYLKINDLDQHEIARIIGIFTINGYRTSTAKGHDYVVVFDKASHIAHDCRPNCRLIGTHHDANSGLNMAVQAVRKIQKGQSITIPYTELLDGTVDRRKKLRNSKYFDCACKRCNDPTEFGTMFNAVKCFQKDCTGYMLPPTFSVPRDKQIPDFVCNKCKLVTPSTRIDKIIEEATMQLSKIQPKDQDKLKKFIEKQSKILHQNHFHIVNAQMKLFFGHANNPILFEEELLKEQIILCKKLTGLLEILAPAYYEKRGEILYSEFKYMTILIRTGISLTRGDSFILYEDCKRVFCEADKLLRCVDNQDKIRKLEIARTCLEEWFHLILSF